jgi:hypothetical protein
MDSMNHEDETVEIQSNDRGIAEPGVTDSVLPLLIPTSVIKSTVSLGGPWNKDIWNRDIGGNNNQDQLGSRQQEEGRSHNSER